MYKAACSESALRPFRVFLWQIKSNLKATVIYETICVMLHHETASGLRSFSTRAALAEAEDFYQEHRLHMSICVALLYRERGHNAFKSDHMLKMTNSLRKFLNTKAPKTDFRAPKPLYTQTCKLEQGQLRAAANPCCRAKRPTRLVSDYDVMACVFPADRACLSLSGRADQLPDHGDDAKHTAGYLQRNQAVQDTFPQRQIVSSLQRLPECG